MADFRDIPSIEHLRRRPSIRALELRFGAEALVEALRAGASTVRAELAREGREPSTRSSIIERIESVAMARLDERFTPSLEPVINATGVILHTNLGRAPLAETAIERVAGVARAYSSLEYDVGRGARGRRDAHAEGLLCRLTGAEAAVVVNNNAAATLVILASLAAGREVIVSRGELVEIGGGFRIPDVMAQSGATLREVGTTNRTRAADYAAAINERTALILRVHPSNFRIEGFTERPGLAELVDIGRRLDIPVAEDLGSGYLARSPGSSDPLERREPAVESSVTTGVDICCFSGDKLLGGPQAGIIIGRRALVDRVRRHPLMRALRVDKMTYAALEATLAEYETGRARSVVPVRRMLAMSADEIHGRAAKLAEELDTKAGWAATLVAGTSAVGGGSAPGLELPTWLLAIQRTGLTPVQLEEALRRGTPPVIARIEKDRVLLDLRTVFPSEDRVLLALLQRL
jgi:L-seryl-tRNA(Ser) seleniumtransferase